MLRIAEAREAKGWTQERLAQAIGTTQQTVQRWESGQTDPQISKVVAISKALGITLSFILGIDKDGQEANAKSSLLPDEQVLVDLYRRMDNENREKFLNLASTFVVASEKYSPNAERIVGVGAMDAVTS